MKMKQDQERVKNLLLDTMTLLCRNGLTYQHGLQIQGLLAITVDDEDVFVVHINEKLADFRNDADCTNRLDVDPTSAAGTGEDVLESLILPPAASLHPAGLNSGDASGTADAPARQANITDIGGSESGAEDNEYSAGPVDCSTGPESTAAEPRELSSEELLLNLKYGSGGSALDSHVRQHTMEVKPLAVVTNGSFVNIPPRVEIPAGILEAEAQLKLLMAKHNDLLKMNALNTSVYQTQSFANQLSSNILRNTSTVATTDSYNSMQPPSAMSLVQHAYQNLTNAAGSLARPLINIKGEPAPAPAYKRKRPVSGTAFRAGAAGSSSVAVDDSKLYAAPGLSDPWQVDKTTVAALAARTGATDGRNASGDGSSSSSSYVGSVNKDSPYSRYGSILDRGYQTSAPAFPANNQVVGQAHREDHSSDRHSHHGGDNSRLPRRPRESEEKRFVCPFCGLSYYFKKHLKFHLQKKHGL